VPNKHHPYHPVIYVRGFAGTQDEIEETVGDPYMGFNIGSTKSRRVWDGTTRRFYFESPLVRLRDELVYTLENGAQVLSNARYDDVYVDGEDLTEATRDDRTKPFRTDLTLPYQSITIFRYYDAASQDFGDGGSHPIEEFAKGLSDLILRLRTLICTAGGKHPITGKAVDNGVTEEDFRVYLVAHSMGGLVCRAFLQNPALGSADARRLVDKVFTYATPHNGIDLRVVRNVPGWAALGEATNFNRSRMLQYLNLPPTSDSAAELVSFPASYVFNLVGSNPGDYTAVKGLSSWAVGEESDGLVRIANATTFSKQGDIREQSPRAFAFRSHSGHYGIVNSEEGFQNLTRFLFGAVRADGYFDVEDVTLPKEVEAEYKAGHEVRASYRFEVVATLRGTQWQMHRRTIRENSAIQRTYDELFPKVDDVRKPSRRHSPHLFSIFLDPNKSVAKNRSVAFAFDVGVLVPDYEIDGRLWLKKHFEGGYLFRDQVIVEAVPKADVPGGWVMFYGYQSETPNIAKTPAKAEYEADALTFLIPTNSPAKQRPGLRGWLRIRIQRWNMGPR